MIYIENKNVIDENIVDFTCHDSNIGGNRVIDVNLLLTNDEIEIELERDLQKIISSKEEEYSQAESNVNLCEVSGLVSEDSSNLKELEEQSTIVPVCCFDVKECPELEKIKLFEEETLKKCRFVHEIRIKRHYKYYDISLPIEIDKKHGYHPLCYSKFTAVPKATKINDDERDHDTTTKFTRSSVHGTTSNSNTGLFEKICLFCSKVTKKHNHVKQKLIACSTMEISEKIKNYATILDDQPMLTKVLGTDFVAKEVFYHAMCRTQYQRRAEQKDKKAVDIENEWHFSRKVHAEAFECISNIVQERVIEKNEPILLTELHSYYQQIMIEIGGDKFESVVNTVQHLEEKLVKKFISKVTISNDNKRKGKLLYNSNMNMSEAIRLVYDNKREWEAKTRDVAFHLRKLILAAPKNILAEDLQIKDILKGEAEIPQLLVLFFRNLICGPAMNRGRTETKNTRCMSLSQDVVYSVTNGQVKPSKQLTLGIAMKSLTGSRKIIDLLNKFGYTASYNTIEEIETELSYTATKQSKILPQGMTPSPDVSTGLAFDNYDRYVETLSGKDTLHDTVGIAYQDITDQNEGVENFMDLTSDISHTDTRVVKCKKRRRTFIMDEESIEPYYKKPKMLTKPLLPLNHGERNFIPLTKDISDKLDTIWLMSLYIDKSTPMWVGWNAKLLKTPQTIQRVWYLPQIAMSPTSYSVVNETLKRSLLLAAECNKEFITVTYDLAIAKMALQIQHEEIPKYDTIFIQLGAFHIELAYFKAIGKFLAESGGPYILTETGVLASGSLNGFITGKHYNRCKRLHRLLSTAMKTLEFEEFLKSKNEHNDCLNAIIDEIKSMETIENVDNLSFSTEMNELMNGFDSFRKNIVEGNLGKTAKYWEQYVSMIDLYNTFTRSTRVGDFKLYLHSLNEIANYFFLFNQPNYARWLTRYHDNLLRIRQTHPDIEEEFQRGKFALQRTKKPFSCLPIDLTLEQTINGDAASQRKGISAITNSISARQRWAKSHYFRTQITSFLFEEVQLTKVEDITKELKSSQIQRNQRDLNLIIEMVRNTMNPFDCVLQGSLFNIATGKSVKLEVEQFLLTANETGKEQRNKFIQECCANPRRFEESIKRNKLNTFATEGKITKFVKNNKVTEVKLERDLFGRILCLALDNKIDMGKVLEYPLIDVPLSLCHIDGTIQRTPKSALLHELEKRIVSAPPMKIDCKIVDGFYYLHLFTNLPDTFGKVADVVFRNLCAMNANRVELVFDRFVSPSIKDNERNRRAQNSSRNDPFMITGPSQKRPSNFFSALRNDNFKSSLVSFFVKYWQGDHLSNFLEGKEVAVTFEENVYEFKFQNGRTQKFEIGNLRSSHIEADSRMVFNAISFNGGGNVVIRTCDTDVLVIALANVHLLKQDTRLFLEIGEFSKNSLRFIDVKKLQQNLGETLSKSLLALHAFTGSDYTASFSRKGKVKPLKILENDEAIQEVFASMGSSESVTQDTVNSFEKFVCKMYGYKAIENVNEIRLETFLKKYKPKNNKPVLSHIKGIDIESLAPCSKVIAAKVLRTNYICSIWKNLNYPDPPNFSPEKCGWTLQNNELNIEWFKGESLPVELKDMSLPFEENEEESEENFECEYESDTDSSDEE